VRTCSTYVKFIQYLVNSSVLSFSLFTKQTTSYQPVTGANFCDEQSVCGLLCLLFITHARDRQQWPLFSVQ